MAWEVNNETLDDNPPQWLWGAAALPTSNPQVYSATAVAAMVRTILTDRVLADAAATGSQVLHVSKYVNLSDSTTDQSAALNQFFADCITLGRCGVLGPGRVKAQNIQLPAGLRCMNNGLVLLCPDDTGVSGSKLVTLTHGIKAVTGFYTLGGAAPMCLLGEWAVESLDGSASATNGTLGCWASGVAEGSYLGDWSFKGIPAGIFNCDLGRVVVGRTRGENMRGYQFASDNVGVRSGTGGTILNFSGCVGTTAGFVRGKNVYKPAIYFSPSLTSGVNNKDIVVDGCYSVAATEGAEALAVAFRDSIDCTVGPITGVGGSACVLLSRAAFEAGTQNVVRGVKLPRVVCENQYAPTASLVCGVAMDSYTNFGAGSPDGVDTTAIHIGTLELRNCQNYGLYRKDGDLTIDKMIIDGHPSSNRAAIYARQDDGNGSTHIKHLVVRGVNYFPVHLDQISSVNSKHRLTIDKITAEPSTSAGKYLVYSKSSEAIVDIGIVDFVLRHASGLQSGEYKYGGVVYAPDSPGGQIKLQNIRKNGQGGVDYSTWVSGVSFVKHLDGIGYTTAAPSSGTWEVGYQIGKSTNADFWRWSGSAWVAK